MVTRMRETNFEITDEDFERFVERKSSCNSSVNKVTEQMSAIKGQRTKLTQEEENKFFENWTESESESEEDDVGGSDVLEKATDDDLRNASKFIAASNMSKLATKYLGLTSQQIIGRDVFNVLKMWRDAMPFQRSKCVRVENLELLTRRSNRIIFFLFFNNTISESK